MASAEELRERARRIRQSAQYAQGQTYRDEMDQARRLENQADWLDDQANKTDVSGDDHG